MKKLKRLFLWYGILTKRILKQKIYIAILLLIPLTVFAIRLMPSDNGGLLSIALARLGNDEFSVETVDRLANGNSVLKYVVCETQEEAVSLVSSGKCDAAWIFREDAGVQAAKFASSRSSNPAVTVVERENSAILSLSEEILCIAMIPYVAYGAYSDFLNDLSTDGPLPEEDLRAYFDSKARTAALVDYYYVDGTKKEESGLLTAPVRGLLAMIILLAALASCMTACREEQQGIFERLKGKKRAFVPFFCHITAVLPAAAATLAALYFCGLWAGFLIEIPNMLLYVIAVSAFCEILRILCRSEITLGAVTPIVMTVMMVLCPVILSANFVQLPKYLLPPFYYLNTILSGAFLLKFVIFDVVICVLAAAAVLIRQRVSNNE